MIKFTITVVTLIAFTLQNTICFGERLFSFTGGDDDEFYSSYQLSPLLPSLTRPNTNYQVNHQRSNMFRALQPHSTGVNSAFANLQAAPSIISPSASIPFVVFGSGPLSNGKKVSKKASQANNNEKAVYSSPKAQDPVDWSAEDMLQHPIDEAPRKSNRGLGHACSYSSDCGSGCCLLDRNTKIRSCQNLARMGERCTKSQVKGDLYVDACPCMRGADLCSAKSRCSW